MSNKKDVPVREPRKLPLITNKLLQEAKSPFATATSFIRCEGWRRYGGAFTLGPVHWEQCKEKAVVMIKVKQEGKVDLLPACMTCWHEAIRRGIKILEARPIGLKKKKKG